MIKDLIFIAPGNSIHSFKWISSISKKYEGEIYWVSFFGNDYIVPGVKQMVFNKNIKGLITKYGGVASHMAIRCSEFHLPAVIGCGELLYEQLKSAKRIHLDCAAQKIEVLCE